jgi:hypothetical protein
MNTNPVLLACTVNKPDSDLTWVFIVVFLPHCGDIGYRRVAVFLAGQALIDPALVRLQLRRARASPGPTA